MKNENQYLCLKPIIGLIGGCGPYATLDIEQKILLATRSFLSATQDQDYYPMLVSYNTQLLDRTKAKSSSELELKSQIKSSIENLISMSVDILILTCQSAHVYLNDMRYNVDKLMLLNMIQVTANHILSSPKKWKRIGLIGTNILYESKLYQTALNPNGFEVILPPDSLQKHLMHIIYTIKMYGTSFLNAQFNDDYIITPKNKTISSMPLRKTIDSLKQIINIINYLIDQKIDGVILGCTELPLLLPYLKQYFSENIFIDSNRLIAEEAILCASALEQSRNKNL
jgi:aspartate racemase